MVPVTVDPTRQPASQLAAAVVLNALLDLVNSGLNTATPNTREIVKLEAISFLTDQHNTWAESREMWCLAANVDPDLLRARVVEFLEGNDNLPGCLPISNTKSGKQARLDGIQEARDMWEERRGRRPAAEKPRVVKPDHVQPKPKLPQVRVSNTPGRKVVKLRSNATRLHSVLAALDGWMTPDELVPLTGLIKGDVNQDLHRLLGHGQVEKQGNSWRRVAPETSVAAANG